MVDMNKERGASFEHESGETAVRPRSSGEGLESGSKPKAHAERGFAAMDPSMQKEIARKGGAAVSKDREHMAQIGRKGGEAVSKDREHMSEIGRKGGKSGSDTRSSN